MPSISVLVVSMIKSSLTTSVFKIDALLCVVVAHVCLSKPQPSNLHLPPTIPAVGLLQHPLLDSQYCFNDLKSPTCQHYLFVQPMEDEGGFGDISGAEITNFGSLYLLRWT